MMHIFHIFLSFIDIWQFSQNLYFSQISSTGHKTSVVCLIQLRDNLTFQLLFTSFKMKFRHLQEIEKPSLVVSFSNVHGHTLISEVMKKNTNKNKISVYLIKKYGPLIAKCQNSLEY